MKRRKPLARKSPLRARKGLRRGRGRLNRRRALGGNVASEKATRRWESAFLSEEFVRFVQSQPCVRCGQVPSEVHHDPTRGAGGTWLDTTPVCTPSHRRRHQQGPVTFWTELGTTHTEANARTHQRWLAYSEGGLA